MRHLLFPTVAQADAFVQDLRDQGAIRPEFGTTSLTRASDTLTDGTPLGRTGADTMSATAAPTSSPSSIDAMDDELHRADGMGGTAEDAGAGAIKGTGVGVVVGAIAGAVATVATGGLAAIPVIVGMAALGSGVGAGVGAIGGAAGVDETDADGRRLSTTGTVMDDAPATSTVTGEQYDRLHSGVEGGGHVIAVADSVPDDVVRATAARHGGQFV
ncbi:hypothetical protein [Deinococcus sp.]|uniref:hypothetical protein n=1 Tax=Deinococcus sp. TaxID=47478 RepID=UPI003CC59831